jgi:hypothetical protein
VQNRRGQSSLSFQAYVDPAAPTQTVTLQAAAGEASVEERLSVQASGKPVLSVPGKQYVAVGKTLAFQVEAASGAGAVTVSAHALPPGARFDSSTGLFERGTIPRGNVSGVRNRHHLTRLSKWKWIRQAKAVESLVFHTRI